jgi:hypothetical protein
LAHASVVGALVRRAAASNDEGPSASLPGDDTSATDEIASQTGSGGGEPRRRRPILRHARRLLTPAEFQQLQEAQPMQRIYGTYMAQKRHARERNLPPPQLPNRREVLKGNAVYMRLRRKVVALLDAEAQAHEQGAEGIATGSTAAKKQQRGRKRLSDPSHGGGGFKRFVNEDEAQRLLTPKEFERYKETRPLHNRYQTEKDAVKGAQQAAAAAGKTWAPPEDWDAVVKGYREYARLSYKAAVALHEERGGQPRRRMSPRGAGYEILDLPTARRAMSDSSFARYEAASEKLARYEAALNERLEARTVGKAWAPPDDWEELKSARRNLIAMSRKARRTLAKMASGVPPPGVRPWQERLVYLAKEAQRREERIGWSWLYDHQSLQKVSHILCATRSLVYINQWIALDRILGQSRPMTRPESQK